MCDLCWHTVCAVFPEKTDEEKIDILICYTSFPFGSIEQVRRQLEHAKNVGFEQVDREIDQGYQFAGDFSVSEYIPGGLYA